MTNTYAESCLERANTSCIVSLKDIRELAKRLQIACILLDILRDKAEHKSPVDPNWVQERINTLEAIPEKE